MQIRMPESFGEFLDMCVQARVVADTATEMLNPLGQFLEKTKLTSVQRDHLLMIPHRLPTYIHFLVKHYYEETKDEDIDEVGDNDRAVSDFGGSCVR